MTKEKEQELGVLQHIRKRGKRIPTVASEIELTFKTYLLKGSYQEMGSFQIITGISDSYKSTR